MGFNIGIVGATGVTGEVTLRILSERHFPVAKLRLFASLRSAGQIISWAEQDWTVEALDDADFSGLDLIISATDSAVARQFAPKMVAAGCIVIDQSSAFRGEPSVPLVVPEINAGDLAAHQGIVSGPNCTTAVAIMAVAPLHQAFGVDSVVSSSYQAISGRGRDGISEFVETSRAALDQLEALRGHEPIDLPAPVQFPHHSAFNLFPHCEEFADGCTTSTEEEKMQAEMRKMLHAPDLHVHATAVRVPVVVGHTTSLMLSLKTAATVAEVQDAITRFPGTNLLDEPWSRRYPTPLACAGIDDVLIGRVREVPFVNNGISLIASGDNLRKGNALNAIQVAELLLGISGDNND